YDIGSPVFDRVSINLRNGKTFSIVCRNNSVDNKYVQSIRLNGRAQKQVWLGHGDIANGGKLELQMGNTPNKELGADPSAFPPSAMLLAPR
ncbi:MAG: uncharacterized protein JWR69_1823, partial [Pedosphaera sp.]|nr:uncharacterized protein [Pedosphaera sp.]